MQAICFVLPAHLRENKGDAEGVLMDTMKRALAFSAILLLVAAAASAQTTRPRRFSNSLLNDVVEMTRASLPDETIIAYVKARRARLDGDVSAEDLIRLRQAGVSDAVVRSIAGVVGPAGPSSGRDTETTYDSREGSDYPVEPDYGYGYGYPYWYGYAYGYPYWYAYSPFFSTTFFVGGGRFFHDGHRFFGHGGGHRGGGHGHGGGGGHGHGGGHGGHGHR